MILVWPIRKILAPTCRKRLLTLQSTTHDILSTKYFEIYVCFIVLYINMLFDKMSQIKEVKK